MVADYTLTGDLTIEVPVSSTVLIQVSSAFSYLWISTENGISYSIGSTNISSEEMTSISSLNDLTLDYTRVGLLKYSTLTFDINNDYIAPNYIIVKNLSSSTVLTLNIRSNRC